MNHIFSFKQEGYNYQQSITHNHQELCPFYNFQIQNPITINYCLFVAQHTVVDSGGWLKF